MRIYLISLIFLISKAVLALEFIVPLAEIGNYFPYRKTQDLLKDICFDPFRIDLIKAHEKERITSEEAGFLNTIKRELKEKGIEGIVFGRGGFESKVLIGGQVFSPADELIFMNEKGEWNPICSENSVVLLSIKKEKGVFLVFEKTTKQTKGENPCFELEIPWEDFFKF